MAVRVRQQPYFQQPAVETQQPAVITEQKKSKYTAKEKLMFVVFIAIVAFFAVAILHKQSSIHQTTIEIQQIEKKIADISKENGDLKVQVDELSTYERIIEKANALGLTLNEKNVKVVPGE